MDGMPYPLLADWGMNVVKLYGVHNAERNCPDPLGRSSSTARASCGSSTTSSTPRDPGHYAQVLEELEKLP